MNIQWIGCASTNFRAGRGKYRPEAIVIHISEGSLASADAWFQNPKASVSAHYCVAKNGEVHQYVKEEDTAYHAGIPVRATWRLRKPNVNPNVYTIGIEHEGHASELGAWPDAQYEASAELIAGITARWGIPVDEDHLVLHREIRGDKTCPGPNFDREKMLGMVREKLKTNEELVGT
ncbi:MAG: peptidoglycan recognition family protein [Bryobacteraceae bacterium]